MTGLYLTECYWPAGGFPELAAATDRLRAATGSTSVGRGATGFLGSLLVPTDEVVFCLFRAQNPAAVTAVSERAGVGLDRVVACRGMAGASTGWQGAARPAGITAADR